MQYSGPQIHYDTFFDLGTAVDNFTMSVPSSALVDNKWHLFTLSFDTTNNEVKAYLDSVLKETIAIPSGAEMYYEYENPLFIGADAGRQSDLGDETNNSGLYFSGQIDDCRFYSSVLSISDVRNIYFKKYGVKDLVWNMDCGTQNFLEEVERFFKFKLPGQKSQYYNIDIIGLEITNEDVRSQIETIIRDSAKKVAPLYAELLTINWK